MNVAFIPVRGGSKSIPLKNIKIIFGKPLVYWTIKAACDCRFIDKIFVATDSDEITEVVNNFKKNADVNICNKMEVIGRSQESATDTATTESAMLEFSENYEFDNIVLIQATSPLLQTEDLNKGFECFNRSDTDSVLSVVRQKRFNWREEKDGSVVPSNYDVFNRPRRQEFSGYLVENGAFYITSRNNLLKSKNRVSGKIRAIEMSEENYFEIDEPNDWLIIEGLMREKKNTKIDNTRIKMFLTDCDGCLTDGGMYYSEKGDELKKFNTLDGMGIKILKEKGIITGIITGETVSLNKRRAEKLNVDIFIEGCEDKYSKLIDLCNEKNIDTDEVVYVGDDINDLECLKNVGWACCPDNAVPEVKQVAKYISPRKGGEGCIRDIINYLFEQ